MAPLPRPVQLIFLLPVHVIRVKTATTRRVSLANGTTTTVCVARHLRLGIRLGVEKYLIILTVFKVVTTGFCLLDVSADLIQRAAAA